MQYLDALFSSIRDASERIAFADGWIARAERAAGSTWQMPFLQAAREAQVHARTRLDEAFGQLDALGSPDRLPALLADLPSRLEQLRTRLEASETRFSELTDAALTKPVGNA